MMSDEELGLDTFFERDGEDQFTSILRDAIGKKKMLRPEHDSMV